MLAGRRLSRFKRVELKSVEDTSWLQLFIKNTALCKHESGRIRCDACPVPEG